MPAFSCRNQLLHVVTTSRGIESPNALHPSCSICFSGSAASISCSRRYNSSWLRAGLVPQRETSSVQNLVVSRAALVQHLSHGLRTNVLTFTSTNRELEQIEQLGVCGEVPDCSAFILKFQSKAHRALRPSTDCRGTRSRGRMLA